MSTAERFLNYSTIYNNYLTDFLWILFLRFLNNYELQVA